MITTDKVIEVFCIVDDFCKEYEKEIQNHQLLAGNVKKRNRQTRMSQSEIITVMVCFHCGTFHNFCFSPLISRTKLYIKNYN